MRHLLSAIKRSVYDPIYYQEILTQSAKYSVKYFFGLALFLALVITVGKAIILVPMVHSYIDDLRPALQGAYPEELVLTMTKGVLASNVAEPYYIDVPPLFFPALSRAGYAHLVVIDTTAEMNFDRFKLYQVPVWLGNRFLVMEDKQNGFRVKEYGPDTSFVFDKAAYARLLSETEPFFAWVTPLVVLAVFIGMFVLQIINFVYLIFGALCIFLLGRFILKQKWSYGTSYRIGLHALTLPVILDAVLTLGGTSLGMLPLLSTALMLLVVYVNFKEYIPREPRQEELPLEEGTPGSDSVPPAI